jgi:hypothetical protein
VREGRRKGLEVADLTDDAEEILDALEGFFFPLSFPV